MPSFSFSHRSLAVSDIGFLDGAHPSRAPRMWLIGALIGCFYFSPFVTNLNISYAVDAASATPAAAHITFVQRWVARQKWNYDLKMDGKLSMRLPANAGVPIAGMPLKNIAYESSARLTLDVLAADDKGVGTVAFRTDRFKMTAESPPGALEIENGEAAFYIGENMYGQPQKLDLDAFKYPSVALRFNARGHFEGVAPIAGAANSKPAPANAPFDMSAVMQMFDPKILPVVWPDHAVAPGDTWTSEVLLPIKSGNTANDAKLAPAGNLQLTYVGPETDNSNHVVQHLHVEGAIKISEEQAALLAAQIGDKRPGKALGSTQKINGDLWFDSALGQVRSVDSTLQTYTAREAFADVGGRQQDNSSWFIFDGHVHLDLLDTPTK